MPNSFRQRLQVEFSKSLPKATELALARWGIDEDTYPLSAAIRHYTRHRAEVGGADVPPPGELVA